MIDAEWLRPEPLPGLERIEFRGAVAHGFHVLAGPNNAGKTRLLRALIAADFGASVVLPEAIPEGPRRFPNDSLRQTVWARDAPPVDLLWSRYKAPPIGEWAYGAVGDAVRISENCREALRRQWPGLDDNHLLMLRANVWPHLATRQAILVPTNRYLPTEGSINAEATLGDLQQWPAVLTNMQRSRDRRQRDAHAAALAAFESITEGLQLTVYGPAIQLIINDAGNERPLSECGDGLRDLVGIVLHCAANPDADILLDEPGLRLHPRTQRRLLAYLQSESTTRSVWVASHDAVFVGALSARSRHLVSRDSAMDQTRVSPLAGREALVDAVRELGWTPGDVGLTDRILLCEGPSDRLAFEAVRGNLEESDPLWGGMFIGTLGGDGSVLGKNPEVAHRIELARAVAPHAKILILLDSSGRDGRERERLREQIESRGAILRYLERPELEDYWLEPALAHAVLAKLVQRRAAATEDRIVEPPLEKVAETIKQATGSTRKGSEILGAVWGLVPMEYRKREAAMPASELMANLSEQSTRALADEVKAAFR